MKCKSESSRGAVRRESIRSSLVMLSKRQDWMEQPVHPRHKTPESSRLEPEHEKGLTSVKLNPNTA
jgi:hypothetical protein